MVTLVTGKAREERTNIHDAGNLGGNLRQQTSFDRHVDIGGNDGLLFYFTEKEKSNISSVVNFVNHIKTFRRIYVSIYFLMD